MWDLPGEEQKKFIPPKFRQLYNKDTPSGI
jgi:hypothetical protein